MAPSPSKGEGVKPFTTPSAREEGIPFPEAVEFGKGVLLLNKLDYSSLQRLHRIWRVCQIVEKPTLMDALEEFDLQCPNCGESVGIFIDSSVEQQVYVEDCPVCCRPMLLSVVYDENSGITVFATREDD